LNKIDPDDAGTYYNLGAAYGKSGMYKEEIDIQAGDRD
jgi:hypothetical protein